MPSPNKRSSSAPPDNRRDDEICDNSVKRRANSADRKSRNGKLISVEIHFLDESIAVFQIAPKTLAKCLFDEACEMLNLIEVDYFGLEYYDSDGSRYWLDTEKPLHRQLSLTLTNPVMHFGVKFYTSDPSRLEDEFTRYLFALQIKHDLANGLMQCNENTAALMASYIIQAQCGDYNAQEYSDQNYVSQFKLIPHQDEEFEWKVVENHKRHVGHSPAEADFNLLETARRCEMYGVKLTPVKDHEGVPLNLSVSHLGVIVFQNQTKVNTFSWAKIRKLSFKRKRFLIKLHQEEYFGDVIEFFFDGRNECKNFWKKCIEQHSFFRCLDVKPHQHHKSKIFSRGSSFRYSGRTQHQVIEFVRHNYVKRQPFQRSSSLRVSGTASNANRIQVPCSTMSIQPLLPVTSHHVTVPHTQSQEGIDSRHERPKSAQEITSAVRMDTEFAETPANPTINQREDLSIASLNALQNSLQNIWCLEQNELSHGDSQIHRSLSINGTDENGHSSSTLDFTFHRRKHVADNEYFILRELIMSERTFKKDIELINTWFKEDVNKDTKRPTEMLSLLFTATEPLVDVHQNFLQQIEGVLNIWEGKSQIHSDRSVSDILTDLINWLPMYERLVERLPFILERINASFRHNRDFERACREFETRKGCYLPYTSFILKPAFHLTHFCRIIEKLINHYDENHLDFRVLKDVLLNLQHFNSEYYTTLTSLINLVILIELQRDITGMDNVVQSRRRFIREGCLLKLSKKGYQQRIFFLLSDIIIYASRSASAQFHFKVHGNLPLHNIMVEETEPKLGINYCFTIYAGDRALMVAANSEEERRIWINDLTETASKYVHLNGNESLPLSPTIMSSNEILDKIDNALNQRLQKLDDSTDKLQYRSNTMAHVCWHRNCSISAADYTQALTNCLSGYLLRKFKNSSGWQKLWVVFTNFCLLFYKSYHDDFPLASLPLLGYTLSIPNEHDNMNKSYVFKLQFKTHVYFFRTESEYAFKQWMNVIKSSTIR